MHEFPIHPVMPHIQPTAHINTAQYQVMYQASLEQPDTFWRQQAEQFLHWQTPYQSLSQSDFSRGEAAWFIGGKLNVSENCIDKHLPALAEQTAIIWEGDEPTDSQQVSYQQLHDEVCRLANGLKQRGVKKGDRVCIYMPMIVEAAYAMLACTRIGAVHSVVFGGFSPEALKDRILDADCQLPIDK